MENNENNKAPEAEVFPLDDLTMAMLGEFDAAVHDAQIAGQAVLQRFLREHKLTGKWSIAANRRELIRADQAAQPTTLQ